MVQRQRAFAFDMGDDVIAFGQLLVKVVDHDVVPTFETLTIVRVAEGER